MTENDAQRYAEALADYERKKKHIFVFPHDDRTLKAYFKSTTAYDLGIKGCLIFVLAMAGIIALFALGLSWGRSSSFLRAFLYTACLFFGLPAAVVVPYSYLYYINYIEKPKADAYIFGAIASIAVATLVYYLASENDAAALIAFFASTPLGTAFAKSVYFEKYVDKPQVKDFDSSIPKANENPDI